MQCMQSVLLVYNMPCAIADMMFLKVLLSHKSGSHALDVDTALSDGPKAPALQWSLPNDRFGVRVSKRALVPRSELANLCCSIWY